MKNKKLLTILGVTTLLVGGMFVNQGTRPVDAATISANTRLYFEPGYSDWKQGNERYAAYFFSSSKNAWANMEDSDSDGIYEVYAPSGSWSNVIFCRKNGANNTNGWDGNQWNQTPDLTYDGSKNLYKFGPTTGWSVYSPAKPKSVLIKGSFWDNWDGELSLLDDDGDGTYSNTLAITDGEYEFKVTEDTKWFGNSGKINNSMSAWVFKTTQGNCKLIATGGNYTFSYNHVLNELSITHTPFTTEEKIERMMTKYYNDDDVTYVRNTVINLTEKAQEELETYFHAKAKQLERTTYFTEDALWMSRGDGEYSYYGSEGGNLTNGTAKEANVVPSYHTAVKNTSMEKYYTTLEDIKDAVGSATWTKSGSVYSSTDATLIQYFLDFTAPCFLNHNDSNANYLGLEKVTIEESGSSLVLKLHVKSGDSGKLVGENNTVLSVATITK